MNSGPYSISRANLELQILVDAITTRLTTVCVVVICICATSPAYGSCHEDLSKTPQQRLRKFEIFDATIFRGKPSPSVIGMKPLPVVYTGRLWGPEDDRTFLPKEEQVLRVAREFENHQGPIVLDVEHWPVRGTPQTRAESLEKYLTLLRWFRKGAPNSSLGYYGLPPIRDYWRAVKGQHTSAYKEWQKENDAVTTIAREVDVLFPSIYTFYDDEKGWERYAVAQICEARRYGSKKVYPFIWFQFHDSNVQLKGQFLPGRLWALQLETMARLADGLVIWGGWNVITNRQMDWDDQAEWWRVTKKFLESDLAKNSGRSQ